MVTEEIKIWEDVEVSRSAHEAERKAESGLRVADSILQRYFAPQLGTPFPLEYAYALLGEISGHTVLDYGSGSGDNSVLLANRGANVIGVDISPELTELARERLKLHGLDHRVEFRVGSAHELPVMDASVEIVFGMAILHHLDLDLARGEVFRVLKPGGRAIFLEPVRNSRIIRFLRGLIPYTSPEVSPYERPLTDAELIRFAEPFEGFSSRAFHLPAINLAEFLGVSDRLLHSMVKADGAILNSLPFLGHFASVRVFEMEKPPYSLGNEQ